MDLSFCNSSVYRGNRRNGTAGRNDHWQILPRPLHLTRHLLAVDRGELCDLGKLYSSWWVVNTDLQNPLYRCLCRYRLVTRHRRDGRYSPKALLPRARRPQRSWHHHVHYRIDGYGIHGLLGNLRRSEQ